MYGQLKLDYSDVFNQPFCLKGNNISFLDGAPSSLPWLIWRNDSKGGLHNLQQNLSEHCDMKHKMNQKGWP